ncbi:MAG TPA: hypothetical protein DCQ93_04680 [Bacteroidetes bacterium]|nr:hypothetical protein [Bacteroidota bacterium]
MGDFADHEKIVKSDVENFFDKNADMHKNIHAVLDAKPTPAVMHSNLYRDYFTRRYMNKYVAPQPGDSILDFGCGVGRVTFDFANRVKKISGIDTSKNMLSVAESLKGNRTNVSFELLSESRLPYSDNSFNKIFSNWVIQHISDQNLIIYLREFHRILSSGGRIYLFEQTMSQLSSNEIHTFRKTEDYEKIISSAGFKKILVKPVMRVPARGMSIWNKKLFPKIIFPALALIDEMTMTRKPEFVKYYTSAFVYEKM